MWIRIERSLRDHIMTLRKNCITRWNRHCTRILQAMLPVLERCAFSSQEFYSDLMEIKASYKVTLKFGSVDYYFLSSSLSWQDFLFIFVIQTCSSYSRQLKEQECIYVKIKMLNILWQFMCILILTMFYLCGCILYLWFLNNYFDHTELLYTWLRFRTTITVRSYS